MHAHIRSFFLAHAAVVIAISTAAAQSGDPYEAAVATHSPTLPSEGDTIRLQIAADLPSSCYWTPSIPSGGGTINDVLIRLPVTITYCDMCVTPGQSFAEEFELGLVSTGWYQVTYAFIETIRCVGGLGDPDQYDTVYVVDGFFVEPANGPCPHQGDVDADGGVGLTDVIGVINVAFRGGAESRDLTCCVAREDIDGDGAIDIRDVILIVEAAFRGGAQPADPCS